MELERPFVSISIIAYNIKDYIRECIDSALMQVTNFPFEIVIGEDCSTDGTIDIIREYESKYPNIIKVIYNKNNIGMDRNVVDTLNRCQGKYVAMMDGDDYWNDPTKLQKQVDFLEANPEYFLTFQNPRIVDESSEIINDSLYAINKKRDYSKKKLKHGANVFISSRCFRNVKQEYPEEFFKLKGTYDIFLTCINADYGKAKYLDTIIPTSYRIRTGSNWSSMNEIKRYAMTGHDFLLFSDYYLKKKDYLNYFYWKLSSLFCLCDWKRYYDTKTKFTKIYVLITFAITKPAILLWRGYYGKLIEIIIPKFRGI